MIAHFHFPGGQNEAAGEHPAFHAAFFQTISQRTLRHAWFAGGKRFGVLGSMKQIPVREPVGAALTQEHLWFSGVKEPGHVEAGHPVLAGKKVDEALAGGALAPLGQPSVVARPTFDKAVERPAFPPIETDPDPDVLAPGEVRGGGAEKENISVISIQSKEAGFTSVDIGRTVKEFIVLVEIAPAFSAVVTEGHPPVSFPGVSTGVEVDRAITKLDQTGFPSAIEGKGSTLVPRLSMVIAVDRVGVALAFLLLAVVGHDPGGHEEPALVRAAPEGDPGIAGAVRNRKKSTGVLPEGNILEGPGFAVIPALVHRRGWVESGQEYHDFPGGLINNRGPEAGNPVVFVVAPAFAVVGTDSQFFDVEYDGLADELLFAPGGTPILRAFQIDFTATPFVGVWVALKAEHENCSVHGDIEYAVDVVLVPYFKERLCSVGNISDFSRSRKGVGLLGYAKWSGSEEEEDERGLAKDLHEFKEVLRREGLTGQEEFPGYCLDGRNPLS